MGKIESFDINAAIKNTRQLLEEDKAVSSSLKAAIEVLLLVIKLLSDQLGLNSQNSSKPPSTDQKMQKKRNKPSNKKPGGQIGHTGATLKKDPNPNIIKKLKVDKSSLPKGDCKHVGFETRQVIDLVISKVVTEYQAEIIEDSNGKRHTAQFPKGVSRPVQYGNNIKGNSVYLSQYQLIPYNRVEENFKDQADIAISSGTICNFNKEAYERLQDFDTIIKQKLINSSLCHADETGININGKKSWLHCVSNDKWTYFMPHKKRGQDAMNEMGIVPNFHGTLCHDHWKPYFCYTCKHVLCNAHHIRELERAWEQDQQKWAKKMQNLLLEINQSVDNAGGELSPLESKKYRKRYRQIINEGHDECPPPDESQRKGKRGRLKRSKARNLLERLMNFEKETLLFMDEKEVPFTNNRGENDIRMTKVQQKISGCFRSMGGAKIFCRIRSYLSTCKKNDVHASDALKLLFEGKLPDFLSTST